MDLVYSSSYKNVATSGFQYLIEKTLLSPKHSRCVTNIADGSLQCLLHLIFNVLLVNKNETVFKRLSRGYLWYKAAFISSLKTECFFSFLKISEMKLDPRCTRDSGMTPYLNRPDVREALHIHPALGKWDMCSDKVRCSGEVGCVQW